MLLQASQPFAINGIWYVECQCDCGRTVNVVQLDYADGSLSDCGCVNKNTYIGALPKPRAKDGLQIGSHYGKWTVKDPTPIEGRILCVCSCGYESYVRKDTLIQNRSTGCRKCSRKLRTN